MWAKHEARASMTPNVTFVSHETTSKPRLSGLRSSWPPASTDLTVSVWWPALSCVVVYEAPQAANASPSSEHWNVARARDEEKPKLGVFVRVAPSGPASIDVVGG